MERWLQSFRTITAVSGALLAGLDIPSIRFIVHLCCLWGLIPYMHESGHGCIGGTSPASLRATMNDRI